MQPIRNRQVNGSNPFIGSILFLLIASPLYASDWQTKDTIHETIYIALAAADLKSSWSTTDTNSQTYEVNPVLGAHPSPLRLVSTFASTAVIHYVAARQMSRKWRDKFFATTIGLRWSMVRNNYAVDDGQRGGWQVAVVGTW